MAFPRSYTDDQLREAVASASSWADVMEGLGKNRKHPAEDIKPVAERLGLDTSHFGFASRRGVAPAQPSVFKNAARPTGSRAGLAVAAKWFLDHGYMVSVPLEVAPYDLVTESDAGLQRVQVKTTNSRPAGRFQVQISRLAYDTTAKANARGRVRRICYGEDEVDYFFILTGAGTKYLIPVRAVGGMLTLTLDEKYVNFVVE